MRRSAMKSGYVWRCTLVVCAILLAGESASLAERSLTRIAENVYSYVDVKNASPGESFGANAGIIIGRDGMVVVDTLTSAKEARRFIKDIKAISKEPIKYVVNTHYHLDHAFGNSEFQKLGAVIIAQEKDADNLKRNGEEVLRRYKDFGLTKDEIEGTVIALPQLTYDRRMTIDLGDRKVVLLHPGAAHSAGDTFVYVPDVKVLFAGDVLFTNFHPYMGEGDLASWAGALDSILAMDTVAIIPGHGPLSTRKDVEDMKAYLVLFDAKAKELCAVSKDPDYLTGEMLKALPAREGGGFLVGSNIGERYLKK